MATFIYTVKTEPQKTTKGQIEADSKQEALHKLGKMGYFPITLEAHDVALPKTALGIVWKIPRKDTVLFTRQLATLLESGVTILNSFRIIIDQMSNRYLSSVLNDIASKIKDGRSISESMAAYPLVFTSLYTSMVHAGESTGTVDKSLKRLSDFLEKEEEFKKSVISALIYPAFVFVVSFVTVIILLGFVIPKLTGMFDDMGQALPLPTKLLIGISDSVRLYWWLLLAVASIAVFVFLRVRNTTEGRRFFDTAKLKLPMLGVIILKSEISRLMRTLSLLFSSGITIVTALDIVRASVDNALIKKEVEIFATKIAGGEKFSQCLSESKLFPPFVINIVTVGEESGSLDAALLRIADDYERDVDSQLKTFTRLLEPLVILVMGLIVGFIVMSMLLPIFQINIIAR